MELRPALHHPDFNPHEREARDEYRHVCATSCIRILIHTSVKLVTIGQNRLVGFCIILIHTSVKLVTYDGVFVFDFCVILIHTSVKLVTSPAAP